MGKIKEFWACTSCTGPCLVFPRQSRRHSLCCEPKTNHWMYRQGHFGPISIVSNRGCMRLLKHIILPIPWSALLRTRFSSTHGDESDILRENTDQMVRSYFRKPGKHQRNKQRFQDLCWKVHDPAQSFVSPHTLCMNYVTNRFRSSE